MTASVPRLGDEERALLLRAARGALETHFGDRVPPLAAPAALRVQRAAFVTLRHADSGTLRGCMGEARPRRPLLDSVTRMTVCAATEDPRFAPVTREEIGRLHIHISALTPLEPIRREQIEVGRHGLMIVRGAKAGLLLPQAATASGWDRATFLDNLCRKASLPNRAWEDQDTLLYGFEAEVWGE